MKALIAILIVLAAVWAFMELVGFYDRTSRSNSPSEITTPSAATAISSPATGQSLPGLPPYLETSLAQAQTEGVEALGKWLKTWGRQVQDPRLAWIELDYVVLLNLKDRRAAIEKFNEVKARVPTDSPVHERILKLQPAYAP